MKNSKDFDKALKIVKGFEGDDKYTNHPMDPGAGTKFGITQVTYTMAGYWGSVKNCTAKQAHDIYKKKYWDKLKLDLFDDYLVKLYLFDIQVNGGRPMKDLQRVLNVSNRMEKDYKDLKVDGKNGPTTSKILNKAMKIKRGGAKLKDVIYECLLALRTVRYIKISEKNKNLETFFFGWIIQRVLNLKKVKK